MIGEGGCGAIGGMKIGLFDPEDGGNIFLQTSVDL
jgi:hypothetical protein